MHCGSIPGAFGARDDVTTAALASRVVETGAEMLDRGGERAGGALDRARSGGGAARPEAASCICRDRLDAAPPTLAPGDAPIRPGPGEVPPVATGAAVGLASISSSAGGVSGAGRGVGFAPPPPLPSPPPAAKRRACFCLICCKRRSAASMRGPVAAGPDDGKAVTSCRSFAGGFLKPEAGAEGPPVPDRPLPPLTAPPPLSPPPPRPLPAAVSPLLPLPPPAARVGGGRASLGDRSCSCCAATILSCIVACLLVSAAEHPGEIPPFSGPAEVDAPTCPSAPQSPAGIPVPVPVPVPVPAVDGT